MLCFTQNIFLGGFDEIREECCWFQDSRSGICLISTLTSKMPVRCTEHEDVVRDYVHIFPVIPSLKDSAFNVVRDYVHMFPSWEDYGEDKRHFHIFLSHLRVSAIIHGDYFPVFC